MEQVITAMSRRLSRPEGLVGGAVELERLYQPLQQDFHDFYPQLQIFAKQNSTAPPER
jgi:acyl carrier protein phosphodiesterase